jgi:hypothetical protein
VSRKKIKIKASFESPVVLSDEYITILSNLPCDVEKPVLMTKQSVPLSGGDDFTLVGNLSLSSYEVLDLTT